MLGKIGKMLKFKRIRFFRMRRTNLNFNLNFNLNIFTQGDQNLFSYFFRFQLRQTKVISF